MRSCPSPPPLPLHVDATIMRSFQAELFSRFLPSSYAGHDNLTASKHWRFMPKWKHDSTVELIIFRVSLSLSLSLSFPFVRGRVLSATSSPPHLIFFPPSSVSCLLLPVFLLCCLPRISLNIVLPSQPWPPSSHPALLT